MYSSSRKEKKANGNSCEWAFYPFLSYFVVYILFLGPSFAPGNFIAISVTTSNITLQWEDLNLVDWNGKFIAFQVYYQSLATMESMSVMTNASEIEVSELDFGTEYRVYVAFMGSGGIGPNTSINVLTRQDSKSVLLGLMLGHTDQLLFVCKHNFHAMRYKECPKSILPSHLRQLNPTGIWLRL